MNFEVGKKYINKYSVPPSSLFTCVYTDALGVLWEHNKGYRFYEDMYVSENGGWVEYKEPIKHTAIVQWIKHGVTGHIMCVLLDDDSDELSADYGPYKILKKELTSYEEKA